MKTDTSTIEKARNTLAALRQIEADITLLENFTHNTVGYCITESTDRSFNPEKVILTFVDLAAILSIRRENRDTLLRQLETL